MAMMTPTEREFIWEHERQARKDAQRSAVLFVMCFAALSGFIVGVIVGALLP